MEQDFFFLAKRWRQSPKTVVEYHTGSQKYVLRFVKISKSAVKIQRSIFLIKFFKTNV